jgi:hypothetical protein
MRLALVIILVTVYFGDAFAQQDPSKVVANQDPVFTQEQLDKLPSAAIKPRLTLKQAMKIAEGYAKRNRIHLTPYFLSEAKLMPDMENNTVENRRWYFRWVRYHAALEYEIVITVSMGGKASRLQSKDASNNGMQRSADTTAVIFL